MKCFIVIIGLVVCCQVSGAAVAGSCAVTDLYFQRHNISADDDGAAGSPICGGQCCGRGAEGGLRNALRRRGGARTALLTRPISDLLLSTRRSLQGHLTDMSSQSQNKTAAFFAQLYKTQATRAHAPLLALYEDIRTMIRLTPEKEAMTDDIVGSPPPRDLKHSAKNFFRDIFHMTFHRGLNLNSKQFTPEYEACLRDAYEVAQPFGDLPNQIGSSLSRSLEAARALLHALALGAGTLAASEEILANLHDNVCSAALLRMAGCAVCKGLDVRPCRNYCLNVARGCFGTLVSELDAPWSGYVEGMERLAQANDADLVLRTFDTKVAEAIMHAMENQNMLEKKIRQECGPPSTTDAPARPAAAAPRPDTLRSPPPDTELLQFAASLATSKKLFANLADRLCDEPDLGADGNEHCWNGNSVGEYSKPLVVSASVNDQRYNPEVVGGAVQNDKVAALGDKLRQTRQVLISHSSNNGGDIPLAESIMQGDEAGEEGSGSGRSYDDDGAYDSEGSGDEGSGSHAIEGQVYHGETGSEPIKPKINAAPTLNQVSVMSSLLLAATLRLILT